MDGGEGIDSKRSDQGSARAVLLRREDMVLRYGDDLFKFALRLTRSRTDAFDLLHDTFERALRAAPNALEPSKARRWMIAVMRNLFIDQVRHQQARARLLQGMEHQRVVEPAPDDDEVTSAIHEIDDDTLAAAVDRLSSPFRDVVQLQVQGIPSAEIAVRLGIPSATVGTRLFRARTKLRAMLSQPGFRPVGGRDGQLPEHAGGRARWAEGCAAAGEPH